MDDRILKKQKLHKTNIVLLFSMLFVLITFSIPVYSNDTHKKIVTDTDTISQNLNIDEISVVRTKIGSDLNKAPLSATTISSKDIKISNIRSIKDMSLSIPNMFMPDYGTKLTSPVYIRGVGSRINSPSVGLYVDGIPFFEKSSFDFDFSDINSIDILRGPQGTLYGRNTMGGIINVTTRSPLSYTGTTATVSYGNYNRTQITLSDYRKITENFGVSISGNYEHNDGYFTNKFSDKQADALNSGGGRIRLRYMKGNTDINIISNIEYSDQAGYPYMMLDKTTLKATEVNYDSPSFYRRFLNSNGMIITHTTDKFKFTSRTSHQYSRDHQGIDQDFSPAHTYYINQRERHNMVSQEFEVSSPTGKRIEWLAGVFGFYQSLKSRVTMDYFATNTITDKFYSTPRYGAAAFGQVTFNDILTDRLSATLGVRYDHEFAKTTYDFLTIKGGTTTPTEYFKSRLNDSQFTPKLSLQYMFNKVGLIYSSVTKGFKAGGFNTSFVTFEERTFDPEYSWNYEVGTKLNFADNKISTAVSLFYIDWSNQQVNQPLSTGKGMLLRNAAKSASKGVEISAKWNIINTLNLQADYGYTHATFKKYEVKDKGDYSGNYLPYIPKNTLSLGLDYLLSKIRCKYYDRIIFGVQYNGVGGLYWNDSNSVYQKYYNTLNARVAITKNIVTLAVWAKNITSTDYAAFYFEALNNSYIQKSKPFTIGVDVSVSF